MSIKEIRVRYADFLTLRSIFGGTVNINQKTVNITLIKARAAFGILIRNPIWAH